MKAQIADKNALSAISPQALTAYVRSEGWQHVEAYGEHADIYQGENRPEIILPRNNRLGDYASVVSRLVNILGEVSNRSELEIYRDLIGADYDVVRVRALTAGDKGTIGLSEGVEMVAQSKEMLLAAACATKLPQPVYQVETDRETEEYMRRVRLGQTEQGSFAVTMMAPVPPMLQPVLNETWANFDDEPYERQVTRRLVTALEASRDAVEKVHSGNEISAFEQAVSAGVSANLCEAVSKLIGESTRLEVSVSWAKTRPTPEPYRSIWFSKNDAITLKEAARTFHANSLR